MKSGIFYSDEVRRFDDVELGGDVQVKEGELELAQQLIEQLASADFDAAAYEDEYRRKVLAAIERKVEGDELVAPAAEEPREQIVDLVAALKRSLDEKRGADGERQRKPARAKGGQARRRKSASG